MRQTAKALALAAMMTVPVGGSISHAAFFGYPRALKFQLERMTFETPALAPLAHTRFCMEYPSDCEPESVDFRRRNIELTQERWDELNAINREVNRDIRPELNQGGVLAERWLIAPKAGECHDYAVTKRHELLERGWPARSLLLSEVVVADGQHHLVLVVRMKNLDLVLDNLSANIRTVAMTNYHWVRAELPSNPKYWSTVSVPSHFPRTAMLDD
jgi:predicted transglutaminase-like cysteine proteinase